MASEEENTLPPDDRWSGFKDSCRGSSLGTKTKEEPRSDLSEYIEKVIEQRCPKKQHERMYKMASHLVRLITGLAQALTTEWATYLQTDKKNEIKTTALRTLTVDQYECMVPLMRPFKLDSFKIVRKRLSPDRYYIKINPGLSKEEALLVRQEWGPHIDKQGHLQANGILHWFNIGLSKACSVLTAESENISALRCETLHDGTVSVHATIVSKKCSSGDEQFSKDDSSVDIFSINIYPVFTLYSLDIPSDLRFSSPIPISGPYALVQKNLKQAILDDLENGKQIIFLESKMDLHSSQIRCSESPLLEDFLCWRLNLNFVEHHVFQVMDKHCKEVAFRHVLVLMNIIKEQFPSELRFINNEILVSSLFILSQKMFSGLTTLQSWFLELMKVLIKGLRTGLLPSFYLPRQNVWMNYSVTQTERSIALEVLENMLISLRKHPRHIYDYTGYIEKTKNKQDEDEDEEEAESEHSNEEPENIEEDYDRLRATNLYTCWSCLVPNSCIA